jgi:two-component system, LytTR family, response regulator
MSKVRVLVVDDEPAARKGVIRLLERDPDIEVVGEARDGREAVDQVRALEPDLLFLDVQMPELNGFEVLAEVGPDTVPAVVFVTAYDAFALRAFEVQALDYILKPFEDSRFDQVLARAKSHLRGDDDDVTTRLHALLASYRAGSDYVTQIPIRDGGTVSFVPVDTIDWIEAADYYARIHAGKSSLLVRYTLNELEQQLNPQRFMRVHRSAIVNLKRIQEIRLDYQNRHIIVLNTGVRVPLSRSRKEALEQAVSRSA